MQKIIACLAVLASPAAADHGLAGRDIVAGAALYQDHCASCHGVNLEGQPNWRTPNDDGTLPAPPHDESGHTWHHDSLLLFEYTKFGGQEALARRGLTDFKSGMPGVEAVLSDDEIWNILGYIQSTWSARAQEVQAARDRPHDN